MRPFFAIATFLFSVLLTTGVSAEVTGRYVHVLLPGYGRTLTLTEVQVFSGSKNIALGRKTSAKHTFGEGTSDLAVDGVTKSDGKGIS